MKRIKSISDFPTTYQIENIIESESQLTDVGGEAFLRRYLDRGVSWFKELFWRLDNAGERGLLYEISQALRTPEFKDLSPALVTVKSNKIKRRNMKDKKSKVVKVGVQLLEDEETQLRELGNDLYNNLIDGIANAGKLRDLLESIPVPQAVLMDKIMSDLWRAKYMLNQYDESIYLETKN